MISKLGDDLFVEILIRLPNPRSTCRCKAVSKRWSSLISDPSFNRRFVSHHQRPDPLLLPSDDPESIVSSILPIPSSPAADGLRFSVLDSFQDLVLCQFALACQETHDDAELDRSYFVCNVFTKQWVALPLAPERPTGFEALVARLVCEPVVSNNLDLGDGLFSVYSEYRFRVACIYQHISATKIDVFCSETGEWIKEALVLDNHFKRAKKNLVSCNGELFWPYQYNADDGDFRVAIAAFNPFRLDIPPASIDATIFFLKPGWDIVVSQGAVHVMVLEEKLTLGSSRMPSSIWRLQEDRQSWRKLFDGVLKTTPRCLHRENVAGIKLETKMPNYEVGRICYPCLHPEKPEIVFVYHFFRHHESVMLSCDLRRGELECFSKLTTLPPPRWAVFHLRISFWPTPIPKYEEFRVLYNGRYSCWVQSNEPTTPSITGPATPPITEKRQPVGRAERSGYQRKGNGSASHPRRLVL